jgi:hypothetical protein
MALEVANDGPKQVLRELVSSVSVSSAVHGARIFSARGPRRPRGRLQRHSTRVRGARAGSSSEEKNVRFLASDTLLRTLHNSLTTKYKRKAGVQKL